MFSCKKFFIGLGNTMQKVKRLINDLAKRTGKWDIANQLLDVIQKRTIEENKKECTETMKSNCRYSVGTYEAIYRNLLAELIGWNNRGRKGRDAEQIMISLGYSSYKLRKGRWGRFIENKKRKSKKVRMEDSVDTNNGKEVVGDGNSTVSTSLETQTTRRVTDCPETVPNASHHSPGNHSRRSSSSKSAVRTPDETNGPGTTFCTHKAVSSQRFGDENDPTPSPSEPDNTSECTQGLDSTSASYLLSDQHCLPNSSARHQNMSPKPCDESLEKDPGGSNAIEMECDTPHQILTNQSIELPFLLIDGQVVFGKNIYSSSLSPPRKIVHADEGYAYAPPLIQHNHDTGMHPQNELNIAIPCIEFNPPPNYYN